MRDRPDLVESAVHCWHCQIRFLTHPRNARRQNLRCPFGCRTHHRRQLGNQRSKKHYQTDQGRRNKKRLNGKRSQAARDSSGKTANTLPLDASLEKHNPSSDTPSSSGQEARLPLQQAFVEALHKDVTLPLGSFMLDEPTLGNSSTLSYLAMIASLIEGRTISREELLHGLRQSMRQRSIGRLARRQYVLQYLQQHPP